MSDRDWLAWHDDYGDPDSELSRRLRIVQHHIRFFLDDRPGPLTIVSACAGQGHDVLGVLAPRPDAARVRATLLETDHRNVDAAVAFATKAGLTGVRIVPADAGELTSYVGLVPADLVLLAGVFGNVADADIQTTIEALPRLCAAGATVIWTRTRRPPDITPVIREWVRAAGFVEVAFDAPVGAMVSVGVARFTGEPQPLNPPGQMFSFT